MRCTCPVIIPAEPKCTYVLDFAQKNHVHFPPIVRRRPLPHRVTHPLHISSFRLEAATLHHVHPPPRPLLRRATMSNLASDDYYENLGVARTATAQEIKTAYVQQLVPLVGDGGK